MDRHDSLSKSDIIEDTKLMGEEDREQNMKDVDEDSYKNSKR